MTNLLALPQGTQLGDFRIERVLGAGGFGITYLADDTALARKVTLKEYFPTDFATRGEGQTAVPRDDEESAADYKWGLDRFIEEAKTLARFNHPNIVRLLHYFSANNTAYMVLNFEEGQSLKSWLKTLGRAPRQRELDAILSPLLDALAELHTADFLHRDIAPDNIIMRTDGSPVLIDFGSARGAIASRSRTVSALVKPGYSPYEQYAETGHEQGPWTDIYALAATLYQAVTGKRPPDAPSRVVKDTLIPARDAALASYRPRFLAAIDRALSLDIRRRPASVAAWRGDLLAPEPKKTRWLGAQSIDSAAVPHADMAAKGAPAEAPVPPPPDAPGRKGGLIDYIDRLKHQGASAPAAETPAGKPAVAAVPAPAPAAELPPHRPRWFAKRASEPSATIASGPARKRTPRPRAVRKGAGWRSFAVKLGIGAIIAGLAVQLERQWPTLSQPPAAPAGKQVIAKADQRTDGKAESRPVPPRSESKVEVRGSSIPASAVRDVPQSTFIAGHKGGTAALQFTDDGRNIVTVGGDGALKVWNAATGGLVRTLDLDAGSATSLSVLGRRALTGHDGGEIALWDLERGEKLSTFKRNTASIWSVAFAGDATRFLATSQDWTVTLWDTRTASAPLTQFDGHDSPVNATAFSPAGGFIASGGADRMLRLWDAGTFTPVRAYRGHKDAVTAVGFSPDGKLVASGAADGGLRIWSTGSSRLFRALPGHKGKISTVVFSPDGETLITSGVDGAVRVWDFKRTRTARLVPSGAAGLSAAAISPDGHKIAVASREGDVRLAEAPQPRRSRE